MWTHRNNAASQRSNEKREKHTKGTEMENDAQLSAYTFCFFVHWYSRHAIDAWWTYNEFALVDGSEVEDTPRTHEQRYTSSFSVTKFTGDWNFVGLLLVLLLQHTPIAYTAAKCMMCATSENRYPPTKCTHIIVSWCRGHLVSHFVLDIFHNKKNRKYYSI